MLLQKQYLSEGVVLSLVLGACDATVERGSVAETTGHIVGCYVDCGSTLCITCRIF